MGTAMQNPARDGSPAFAAPVYNSAPPQAISRANWHKTGRTPIAEIEDGDGPAEPLPLPVLERSRAPEPAKPQPSCIDAMAHCMQCPLCSQLYAARDPLVYYIIIAVLSITLVMLLIQRRNGI